MFSTPPATNSSPSPSLIARAALATALMPEAQRRLTVSPGTDTGRPASSTASAERVLMMEHAVYSVISPEAGASILWRTPDKAPEMAEAMKTTAQDLLGLGVIDRIVQEPVGGAHREDVEDARLHARAAAGRRD